MKLPGCLLTGNGLLECKSWPPFHDSFACRFLAEQPACWCWRSRFCCSSGASFRFASLPVEAYPDVANNYVQVITQWPGIAAEEVEQQVTIPIEIAMNGIPHLAALALRRRCSGCRA